MLFHTRCFVVSGTNVSTDILSKQQRSVAKLLHSATFARHARVSKLPLVVWLNANVAITVPRCCRDVLQ